MGNLVITPASYGTTYVPNSGFSVLSGNSWYNTSATEGIISNQTSTEAGSSQPGIIVDTTNTTYGVARGSAIYNSQLGANIADLYAGIAFVNNVKSGFIARLQGDDSYGGATGWKSYVVSIITNGVLGAELARVALPAISTATTTIDVIYNPFTKAVVGRVNGVLINTTTYTGGLTLLNVGVAAYRPGGSYDILYGFTSAFNSVPYLKAKHANDSDFRINMFSDMTVPAVTAAVGDYIFAETTYRKRDEEPEHVVSTTPTWNGQNFVRIGTHVSSTGVWHDAFYIKVTTAGTAIPVANVTPGSVSGDYVNGAASIYVYGGVTSDTISTPLTQTIASGNAYVAPSLTFTGLTANDIGLDILALSGMDLSENNQVWTVHTPSSNQLIVDRRIPSANTNGYGGATYVSETYAVGTATASWVATTPPPLGYGGPNGYTNYGFVLKGVSAGTDTTPDTFTFTPRTGVGLSSVITSAGTTISGIDAASAITIVGGTYSINGGSYTASAGTVVNGDVVTVRVTSSATVSTAVNATVTIGGVAGIFTVTTSAANDTTPAAFTLTAQTGVTVSTVATSNTITVADITAASAISISGSGTYSINGGSYTASAGTVVNGDTVAVHLTSSASAGTAVTTVLTIGGVTSTFSVTTVATDTTPDAFTFTAQTGAVLSTVTTSNTITVAGINAAAAITIAGGSGTYSKNGGAYVSTAGTVVNGDTVTLRITSSATNSTAVTTTLTIGGVSGTFSVTTVAAAGGGGGAVLAWSQVFSGSDNYNLPATAIAAGSLIGLIYSQDGNQPGLPAGYTAITDTDITWDGQHIGCYYKLAAGNEANSNVNFAHVVTVRVCVWTNVDQTTPIVGFNNVTSSASSNSPFNIVIPSITTASANTVLVAVAGLDLQDNTSVINYTAPTGFTQIGIAKNDYDSFAVAYKLQAAAGASGTITYPATSASSVAAPGGFVFGIKSGSAGGGTDSTPDTFTLTAATDVNISTATTSNTITVAGIDTSSAISIAGGGQYSKNGGAYTSSAGTVVLGDTVSVQVTSSASYSTGVNTTLTIGGVSATFTVTTRAVDVTPDVWTFTAVTGAALSTVQTSNTMTVAGVDAGQNIAISITGGSGTYSKNGGAYTAVSGTVQLGDTVSVRVTSSASYSTAVNTTLNIGAVSVAYNTTTRAVDTTPDNFSFTTATGVALSTLTESGSITVAGIDAGQNAAISVSNGEYAVNTGSGFGAFTTSAGNVQLGHIVKVRNTSSSSTNTTVTTTLTIGGVSGTFATMTGTPDTVPDAFTFVDQTGVNPSTTIDSAAITVAGVSGGTDVAISVSGGQYAISSDGGTTYGAFTASAGNVRLGYLVKARVTSSASFTTGVSAVVTIGTVSDTFTATTRAVDVTPSAFTFTAGTAVNVASVQTSNTITVAGVDAGQNVSISISGGTYSKNGGSYTASAGTVVLGDTVAVRVNASTAANTATSTTLTMGGVTGTFTVTTATPVITAVNASNPINAGQTTVSITTTGFSNVTGITIGGVACTAVTGSNNTWTFTAPDWVDGGAIPVIGANNVIATDGTVTTAAFSKVFAQRANQGIQQLTSIPATTIGYVGYYSGTANAAINDFVAFDLPATLATASGQTVPLNGVDPDGRIFSDYSGAQSMWLRKASTGNATLMTVTTPGIADTVPDAFVFTANTTAEVSTVTTSNTITVAGVTAATPVAISISGNGTYSKNGGSYTNAAGTVVLGDTVQVRLTSSTTYSTALTTTVTIGGVTGTFSVTTRAVDVTPDVWSFTNATNVALSSVNTSNTITVSGVDAGNNISVSITGGSGTYSKNGGAFTATAGTVVLGDTLAVRVTASASNATAVSTTLNVGAVSVAYSATTLVDTIPNAFTFTAATGTEISTATDSNPITVAGVAAATDVAISITGGSYAIDSGSGYGAFTTSAGVIRLGWSVKVRVTSSASYSTAASATLTIGGVTGAFSVTTRAVDTTPDAFTLTAVTNAEAFTVTESNVITVAGLDTGVDSVVTITGAEYAINTGSGYGAYTQLSSNIRNGHLIKVRLTSSTNYATAVTGTLNIGGVSSVFSVTTRAADLTPNALSFPTVSGAALSTLTTSAASVVSGIDAGQAIAISITGGNYSKNGGSYTASAGTVVLGDSITVQTTSSGSANTSVTATVTIGGVPGTFVVSTGVAADTTPDAFTFTAETGAAISTNYDSAQIVVAGVTAATDVQISIVGGSYSINSGSGFGAYTSSAGVVRLGYAVKIRLATTSAYANVNTATLTIGGVSGAYVVTTRAADTTPDAFTFTGVNGATASQLYESNVITVAGVDAAVNVPISVVNGEYAINNGTGFGAYTTAAGNVQLGWTVKTRIAASASGNTTVTSTVTIGTVSGVYNVNTGVIDTVPDAFSFPAVANSEINTANESAIVTIAGVTAGVDVAIAITGGSYSVNSGSGFGAYVTSPGVVRLGYQVKVRVTTTSAYSTVNTATVVIGTVSGAYAVTTRVADTTPTAFTLTAVTGANLSTDYESNAITVAGVDSGVDVLISISGGLYAINSGSGFGAYGNAPSVVRAGYTVKVKLTTGSSYQGATTATLTIGGILGVYSVTTRAADTTPNVFVFTPITSANVSSLYDSNDITLAGVDSGVDVPISITGGTYLINSGSGWSSPTASAGVIHLGDRVKIRVTSPSTIPATVTATLTIGGVSASYVVSTSLVDTTPDAFTFMDALDAAVNTPYFSTAIIVTGIDADQSVPISILGGQYRVTSNGVNGPWLFTSSTVNLDDQVTVYCSSGAGFAETKTATLTIGGVVGLFNVVTRAADTTPKAFVFTPLTGAVVSTQYESNVVVVTSVDAGVDIPVSISNSGQYAIATGTSFGEWTNETGIIKGGQSIKVRLTSSAQESTNTSTTLTIGGIDGVYTITTRAPATGNVDNIPDPFEFTAVVNAALNTQFTSNVITVTDVTANTLIPINVTGGTFYIDAGQGYGAQLTSSSTVKLGYKVKVAVRSSTYFNTNNVATVNIGGVVAQYSVTSRLPVINPAPITLPKVLNASKNTYYASTQAVITGIETGATATMSTVGGLEYQVNRGSGWEAWTTASTQVKSTDLVKTRLKSSANAAALVTGRLVIASVSNTFTVTTK